MVSVAGTLFSELSQAWRPRERIPVAEWVSKNIRLSAQWEASSGPYNTDDNPFLVFILECFDDPEVYEITVKKSTQIGGTLLLIAAIIALSELDPAPAMVVLPDKESAIELRDRLYGNCLASGATRDKVPPQRNWNTRHIDLKTSRIYLAWSGSAQRLRGRACKRVFRSEIDVWNKNPARGGDPIKASAQRVKRFYWSQIYNESTPDSDSSYVSDAYDKSNRQQWWCKCPECGKYQILRFFPHKSGPYKGKGGVKGITDSNKNVLPKEEAMDNAYYECISGCRLDTFRKNQCVLKGVMLPAGQYVDDEGMVCGKPRMSRRHSGFHLWAIHSPIMTISRIVEAYCDAVIDNKLREFFQDWLGLRFASTKRSAAWDILGKRLRLSYKRKSVPQDAWFLTSGIDVQEEGVYYVIRAWGHAGTSWLVDWGFLQRYDFAGALAEEDEEEMQVASIKTDLAQIESAIMLRRYAVVGDAECKSGKRYLRAITAGIDANYRTRDVHEFIQSRRDSRLRAVRGDHKVSPRERFRRTVVEEPKRGGEKYDGGLELYGIFTAAYKEDLLERWIIEPGKDGFWGLPSNIVSSGERYLKQITNEKPQDVLDRDGHKVRRWILEKPSIGNHYFDAEIYSMAVAEMYLAELGRNWDSSKWVASNKPINPTANVVSRDREPGIVVARDYQL